MAGEARTGFRVFHGFVGGGATLGVGTGAGAGAGAGALVSALLSSFLSLVASLLGAGTSFSLPSLFSLAAGVLNDDPALEFVESAGGSFETDEAVVPFTTGDTGVALDLAGVFVFAVGLAVGTGSVEVLDALAVDLEAGNPQAGLEGGASDGTGAVRDVEAAD